MRSRILDFQCFRNLFNNFADKQKSHEAEADQTAKLQLKQVNGQFQPLITDYRSTSCLNSDQSPLDRLVFHFFCQTNNLVTMDYTSSQKYHLGIA